MIFYRRKMKPIVAPDEVQYENLIVTKLRLVELEPQGCELTRRLIRVNSSLAFERSIFRTTNEYLNSLIDDDVTDNCCMKRIYRKITVAGIALHIKLTRYHVAVSIGGIGDNTDINFRYEHITEGLLSHIARNKHLISADPYQACGYHYKGVCMIFDYCEGVNVVYAITIHEIGVIDVAKYGDSLDEVITKCESLLAAIYDNYIEPIGIMNVPRSDIEVIVSMFNRENITMLKSAKSQ